MSTHTAKHPERTPVVLMDQVYGESKTLITQASVASISYQVFEYPTLADARYDKNGAEVGAAAALAVADVVYDALQTAPPWDSARDAAGYNFRFTLPAARRPTGGTWHRVQIWITPAAAGEEPYPLVWIVETTPLAE